MPRRASDLPDIITCLHGRQASRSKLGAVQASSSVPVQGDGVLGFNDLGVGVEDGMRMDGRLTSKLNLRKLVYLLQLI